MVEKKKKEKKKEIPKELYLAKKKVRKYITETRLEDENKNFKNIMSMPIVQTDSM